MKIYIVGCAKSGTTLMRRMFQAFEGVAVIPREIDPFGFSVSVEGETGILVGKRTFNSIFSNSHEDVPEMRRQLIALQESDCRVLCMVRNPWDVLKSGVPAQRWIASILQLLSMRRRIDAIITYEALVRYPDDVQRLLENIFGLEAKARFSEYPAFFEADEVSGEARYEPRPLAPDRIHKAGEVEIDDDNRGMVEHLARVIGYGGQG